MSSFIEMTGVDVKRRAMAGVDVCLRAWGRRCERPAEKNVHALKDNRRVVVPVVPNRAGVEP
jgi:hypothetical protein